MQPPVVFESEMIAPCGINCGACRAFLREKNSCPGCRTDSALKPKYCISCIIANCDLLAETRSGYCYDCEQVPCKRLKQLDKRYRTKYRTGLIQNLMTIKEMGMSAFLKLESDLRTCTTCGSVISVHSDHCTVCSAVTK